MSHCQNLRHFGAESVVLLQKICELRMWILITCLHHLPHVITLVYQALAWMEVSRTPIMLCHFTACCISDVCILLHVCMSYSRTDFEGIINGRTLILKTVLSVVTTVVQI